MPLDEKTEQTVMKMTLQPGWHWSECIRPHVPGEPDRCPGSHLGYCVAGQFKMWNVDNPEDSTVVCAGDVYQCKPGHLATVLGSEVCQLVEFSQKAMVTVVNDLEKKE